MTHTITNLRLVQRKHARLDAGVYYKAVYSLHFERNGRYCSVPVENNGEKRPLGQDAINAMRSYIKRGEITEEQVVCVPIID